MKKKDLLKCLAEATGLDVKTSQIYYSLVMNAVGEMLLSGETVKLGDIGNLFVGTVAGRPGEEMVKLKRGLKFQQCLRDTINLSRGVTQNVESFVPTIDIFKDSER